MRRELIRFADKKDAIDKMMYCLDMINGLKSTGADSTIEGFKDDYYKARTAAIIFGMNVDRFPKTLRQECKINENIRYDGNLGRLQ